MKNKRPQLDEGVLSLFQHIGTPEQLKLLEVIALNANPNPYSHTHTYIHTYIHTYTHIVYQCVGGKVCVVEEMCELQRQILSFVENVLGFKKGVAVYTTDNIKEQRILTHVGIKNDVASFKRLHDWKNRRGKTLVHMNDALLSCKLDHFSTRHNIGRSRRKEREVCCGDCYNEWCKRFREFKKEILEEIVTLRFKEEQDVCHDFRSFN